MFPPDAFRPLLVGIGRILDAQGVRYALTGGLVSAFYSEPRYTQDADLVVDQKALLPKLDAFLHEVEADGYLVNPAVILDAVQRGRQFQLLHKVEALKLDLYPRELVEGELSRAVFRELFEGVMVPIISRNDLVVCKLVWVSRGSHKGRRDIRQLMRRAGSDDQEHIRRLAELLRLRPLLDEVLAERDEIDLDEA